MHFCCSRDFVYAYLIDDRVNDRFQAAAWHDTQHPVALNTFQGHLYGSKCPSNRHGCVRIRIPLTERWARYVFLGFADLPILVSLLGLLVALNFGFGSRVHPLQTSSFRRAVKAAALGFVTNVVQHGKLIPAQALRAILVARPTINPRRRIGISLGPGRNLKRRRLTHVSTASDHDSRTEY